MRNRKILWAIILVLISTPAISYAGIVPAGFRVYGTEDQLVISDVYRMTLGDVQLTMNQRVATHGLSIEEPFDYSLPSFAASFQTGQQQRRFNLGDPDNELVYDIPDVSHSINTQIPADAIPEPATLFLLGAGFLTVGIRMRRL